MSISLRPILRARLAFPLLLALTGCGGSDEAVEAQAAPAEAEAEVEETPADPDALVETRVYTNAIKSRKTFQSYSDQVAGERFTKLIVNLKDDSVWYFDVNVFPMHSDFVFAQIYQKPESPEGLADLMANYNEDKPEFLFVYLIHHLAQDLWTFAFWEGDRMKPEHVEKAYAKLKETFFAGKDLKFRPDSPHHEMVAEQAKKKGIPVVTNDEIYTKSTYELFNEGTAIGKLRVIDGLEDSKLIELTYDKDEILILNEVIPTLTVVSGIVSEEFSTPLSHVALRARAWNVPHIGLRNATELFKGLEGQTVILEAKKEGYTLRPATAEEVSAWKQRKIEKARVLLPSVDLEEKKLRFLDDIRKDQISAYGAKTSNLGEIVHVAPAGVDVPKGFGIPIHYYKAHMDKAGLTKKVHAMLADAKFQDDPTWRQHTLKELQLAIALAPLDKKLLDEVMKKVESMGPYAPGKGVFVRSSTNAEDLPGFNGAGLYDTVPNVIAREDVEKAIKRVWGSVWNQRAYEERQHYGIDHRAVYGSCLVQVGVNATAAGVLVTSNVYEPTDTETYTISAKSGLGMRVVEGTKIPEQILFNVKERNVKVLSRSDEKTMLVFDEHGGVKEVPVPGGAGQPVLTEKRVRLLADAARAIVEVFPKDAPQDIEWVFEGDRLWIVQARPYVYGKRP